MKISATLIVLSFLCFSSKVYSQDCFEGKGSLPKGAQVVTGIGFTANEARIDLYKKLPQIGVLQKINVTNTRVKTEKDFADTTKVTTHIDANIDLISTVNCRINGQYAMSAIVPIDKVDYLPWQMKRDSQNGYRKEFFEFDYAQKLCKNEAYTLVYAPMNSINDITRGKVSKHIKHGYVNYYVFCGKFEFTTSFSNHGKHTISDEQIHSMKQGREIHKYNMIYFSGGPYDVHDFSYHLQLEMIKNAMINQRGSL